MDKVKIKLSPWWTDNVIDRFVQQFIGEYFINYNIEIVNDNSYDYLIVLGNKKDEEDICVSEDKVIVFTMEPHWSSNTPKNAHEYSTRVYVPDKQYYPDSTSYIESPLYMFYGGSGDMHAESKWNWSINDLMGSDNPSTKLLSIVQRNQDCSWIPSPEENNVLYGKRCALANDLLSSDIDIDIYGQYWEQDNNKIKGEAWNKKLGLVDYKFSIAVENTAEKNYYTEKFWDCILTQTVPVYYGCPNISEIVPSDTFISLPDITNYKECRDIINHRCQEDVYTNMLAHINELKYQFFADSKYNIWHKIQEEVLSS